MASLGRWLADRHGFDYPHELEAVVLQTWSQQKETLIRR
jgi:hypothetical protein